jgi:hypothetical protein
MDGLNSYVKQLQQLMSDMHCVGLHCHADVSHITEHVFGPPKQHLEG